MRSFKDVHFRLRPTLVNLSIFMITLSVLGTAIPAYYSAKKSISSIWSDLAKQISEKTTERILRYFMIAPPTAQFIEGLVDGGEIDLNQPTDIFDACYQALLAYKDLTALFLVRPDGSFQGIIENFDNQRYLASHRTVEASGKTTMANYTIGPNGKWALIDTQIGDYDPRKRPYWPSAVAHKDGGWSKPYHFLSTPETGFSYTLPQITNNQLHGYWILNFQINFVSDYLKQLSPGKNGLIFIVSEDGELIADSIDESAKQNALLQKAWKEYIRLNKQSGQFQVGEHLIYANKFPAFSKIPWIVITLIHEADFLRPIQKRSYDSMLIGVLICAFFGLIFSFLFSRISRRLNEIASEMDKIGDLGIAQEIDVNRHSYIREVNTMNTSLQNMKIGLRSFAKYLHLDLVKTLVRSGHLAELGGEKKEITVLFADLSNFTQVSENLPPDQLAEMLDEHLTSMSTEVDKQGGVVDKYIGDAVMALWGAPNPMTNHALAACKAALNMKRNEAPDEPIKQRIGINTGFAIVGNFGSKDRMDYTAIGDSVNLASRLENLNRFYETQILIGEETAKVVQEAMVLRPLDYVTVKGKTKSVLVYELIGEKTIEAHVLQPAIDKYTEALNAYRKQNFARAADLFDEALKLFNDHDVPSTILAKRCRAYMQNPPPKDWDGSRVMEEK